jgi:hypothetical protein
MGKTYEELMTGLKPARRARVAARAAELLAAEKSLRELRMAHQLTQQGMARNLGGELVLTAHFPGHDPVGITGIEDLGRARKGSPRPVKRKKRA